MSTQPVSAKDVEARRGATIYPEPFAKVVAGRTKRKLGDLFGLTNFGVNLTHLDPGSASALFHSHVVQDEFIYVLEGTPTLLVGDLEYLLVPGDCFGFKAGTGDAHQLVNRSEGVATYLEIGDRTPGDRVIYPKDNLAVRLGPDGAWLVTRKDGTPF